MASALKIKCPTLYVRQPASVEWPTCPYNFDNQDEEPGLSDQATPSVRAKFCQVNASSGVTEDGFELTRFVNCLMRRFCISLKVTIKSDNTERLQQEQQVREENRQNTWFAQSLFFTSLATIQQSSESALQMAEL